MGEGAKYEKIFAQGRIKWKGRARQITLKNIDALEKNHTRKMITKKN